MTRRRFALLAATALAFSAASRAAEPPALVSFDALQKRLDDPKLRLVDVRPRAEYDRGHIPGAVWADVKAASALASKPGGLEDRAAWSAWVAPLGIDPDAD